MKTYEFSIIASGMDPSDEAFETRFYGADCHDATVSFQKGHIIVDFAREASSLANAIASAVEAVRKTGATVERIEPDPLVNLSDIASRAGLTRAAVTHYSKGERAEGFPPPVARVTSNNPLWRWSVVAKWMCQHNKSQVISRQDVIEADVFEQANQLLDWAKFVGPPSGQGTAP